MSRLKRGDFFLAISTVSMILKGLSMKIAGHLGIFLTASNKTNNLVMFFRQSKNGSLAVSMIPKRLDISI